MSVLKAYKPVDMSNPLSWWGNVESYGRDHITISTPSMRCTYYGDFSFDAYGTVFGTVTGFRYWANQELVLELNNLDVNANFVYRNISAYNPAAVYAEIFKGADQMRFSDGHDVAVGFGGADQIFLSGGNDVAYGGAGNDKIYGGSGQDRIWAGEGHDYLDGGTGADFLWGGQGNDKLYGQSGNDRLEGGSGADRLYGGAGHDQLSGDAGQDALYGGAERDVLKGGAGADSLYGGAGRDRLIGGSGKDLLWGGADADVFVFERAGDSTPNARDVIQDFQRRIDKVDLSDFDANATRFGTQEFDFIGGRRFSGEAGELRYAAGVLSGDTNGDKVADFAVFFAGKPALTVSDFIL